IHTCSRYPSFCRCYFHLSFPFLIDLEVCSLRGLWYLQVFHSTASPLMPANRSTLLPVSGSPAPDGDVAYCKHESTPLIPDRLSGGSAIPHIDLLLFDSSPEPLDEDAASADPLLHTNLQTHCLQANGKICNRSDTLPVCSWSIDTSG